MCIAIPTNVTMCLAKRLTADQRENRREARQVHTTNLKSQNIKGEKYPLTMTINNSYRKLDSINRLSLMTLDQVQ